jgi:GT2 family glycosyltransferase
MIQTTNLPYVSIIVLNYNSKQYLPACFESLSKINYPRERYEILMPDNASSDGSVEFISREFPRVTILPYNKNYGFAEANNRAAAEAKGEYIAFLNPDTEVDKNWLIELVKAMKADEAVACCGGKVLFLGDRNIIQNAGHKMSLIRLGCNVGLGETDNPKFNTPGYTLHASGCAMLVRKDVFFQVSGFDPDYFMFIEDVDFGLRLWLYGYKVVYVPTSITYHELAGSFESKTSPFGLFHVERNRLATLVKNLEWIDVFRGMIVSFFYSLVKLVEFLKGRRTDLIRAMFAGKIGFVRELPKIIEKRRVVQRNRKIDDRELYRLGLLAPLKESVKEFVRLRR